MAEQATYILVDGKADSERLRIMTEAFWPWTRGFLEKAGLQKNQSFLDLGCGNGANTVAIARHFSLSGKVHAAAKQSRSPASMPQKIILPLHFRSQILKMNHFNQNSILILFMRAICFGRSRILINYFPAFLTG
jgi:hypothetical protein